MKRSKIYWFAFAATVFAACGDNKAGTVGSDAKLPDGGGEPDAPQQFLAASAYEDLIAIDPQFPFGVVRRNTADVNIVGSHWGRHDGPIVTAGLFGGTPMIVKWTIPTGTTDDAASASVGFTEATGLPASFFYSGDGMIDLPFASASLLSYTGSPSPFPGEALLYTSSYDAVTSRAKANGYYSGVGVTDGTTNVLVYSGLSALSATASATNSNGLYAAPVCNGKFLDAACALPMKLATWNGSSGPVVADADGNVFVAASRSDGPTSDSIFAVTQAQALAAAPTTAADLADVDSGGTSSLAAVAATSSDDGWVVGLGFDPSAGVYASSYTHAVAKGTVDIAKAITPTADVTGLSVFTDPDGNLWLAVTTDTAGSYLELQRRP